MTGSTPIQRVKDEQLTEPENIVEFQTYSQCVDQLLNGQVDAVTTDDAILRATPPSSPTSSRSSARRSRPSRTASALKKDDAALREQDQRHARGRRRPTARGSRSTTRRSASPALRRTRRRCSGTAPSESASGDPPRADRSATTRRPHSAGRPRRITLDGRLPVNVLLDNSTSPGGLRRHGRAVPGRRDRLASSAACCSPPCGSPRPGRCGLRRRLRQHRAQHPADAVFFFFAFAYPRLEILDLSFFASRVRRPVVYTSAFVCEVGALGHQHGAGRSGRGRPRAGLDLRPDARR